MKLRRVAAGASQPLTKVLRADLQHFGGDDVGHLRDCAEDVAQALLAIEQSSIPEVQASIASVTSRLVSADFAF